MNGIDEHAEIDRLLPWYANGSLDAATRARINRHVERCNLCREELAFLGDIRDAVSQSVADEPAAGGFETLPADLRRRIIAARRPVSQGRRFGGALAASLLAALALGVAITVSQMETPRFRTATTTVANSDTMLVVVRFTDNTRLDDVNRLLREHRAIVVEGPDGRERWTLEIPLAGNTHREVMETLKRAPGVVHVEPASR